MIADVLLNTTDFSNPIISVIPMIAIICVAISILGVVVSFGRDSDYRSGDEFEDDEDEVDDEESFNKKRRAEEILEERYAQGKISTEEYNERRTYL